VVGFKKRTAIVDGSAIAPERLSRLREICFSFPDCEEKEAWGDPTWRIKNKIFAVQKGNHKGARPSVWLKGGPGAQAMLIDANPASFFVPPYVGSKGWIGLYLDTPEINWSEFEYLAGVSYALVRK